MASTTPRFITLKTLAAAVLASGPMGWLIRRLAGDRIPFHGVRLYVNEDFPDHNVAALTFGIYESAEHRFTSFLSPTLPVVECGAGIGAISSSIARRLAPGQMLVCVEGNPRLLSMLKRNLQAHASHLDVDVVEAAVGGNDATLTFHVAQDNLHSREADSTSRTGSETTVKSVSLAALAARKELVAGWQLVSDIEGGEAAFLLANERALDACQRVVIELHDGSWEGSPFTADDLAERFVALGFHQVARYGQVYVFERVHR